LEKDPPEGDIKRLTGGLRGYRLRSGDYRIFFDILKDRISVTRIFTRGHAYKNRR
jgi:mRNA-degrading endonuclease RelE of RelBE toxin-antitoxin system